MCLYHFCLSYRGRESFSGGGASEIGGARLVGGGGGGMKAKKGKRTKKNIAKTYVQIWVQITKAVHYYQPLLRHIIIL